MTLSHPGVILRPESARPSPFWQKIRRAASQRGRRLFFPEATDARILSAARFLAGEKICRPVLVGREEDIRRSAREFSISLDGVEILADGDAAAKARLAEKLFQRKKDKGMTPEAAAKLAEDPLYFACLALAEGLGDGVIGGAVRTTAETVRAGFSCLGLAPGAGVVFGLFVMECPNAAGGPRRLILADSAVSPHPSHRVLAQVGIEAAGWAERILEETPRVAYLSFSTRASAEDESVAMVRQAAELARKKAPGLIVDGEIQADAALLRHIAEQKGAGDSGLDGKANVLIFPDLNAGNIAYKLVQHLGGARAVGPILAGLSRPMSDLSRGCTDEDVVDAAALVSLMNAG